MWILKCLGLIMESRVWIWFSLFNVKKNSWSIWTVFFLMAIVVHRWQLHCLGACECCCCYCKLSSVERECGSLVYTLLVYLQEVSLSDWVLSLAWVAALGSHRNACLALKQGHGFKAGTHKFQEGSGYTVKHNTPEQNQQHQRTKSPSQYRKENGKSR